MNYEITTIGQSGPHILIVGCLHGDEIVGKMVIDELKKYNFQTGIISLLLAHPVAIEKNKRYLERDLNRSFLDDGGDTFEDNLAQALKPELMKADIVIDIHTTNSKIDSLVVVTKITDDLKKILNHIPIKKVALIPENVFNGSLIGEVAVGVSIEFGPDKTGENFPVVMANLKMILINLGLLPGEKKDFSDKDLYEVTGVYQVSNDFITHDDLTDFTLITKGQLIGKDNGQDVVANQDFYPLFLGNGRYSGTMSLMADKKSL